jgi:hypothetical protein
MVMFIEVPPEEEDDPAPELDIVAIHRENDRKGKNTAPRQRWNLRYRRLSRVEQLLGRAVSRQGEAILGERWRRFIS